MQKLAASASKPRQCKQLVFDCRYGWVYDEWKEPAAIAHLGGRGMFSVVPLTAAAFGRTLNSANKAADMVTRCIRDPPPLQAVQIFLRDAHVKADKDLRSWFNQLKDYAFTASFKIPAVPRLPVNLFPSGRRSLVKQDVRNGQVAYVYELVEDNSRKLVL